MPPSSISKAVLACKIIELLLACTCMGLHVHAPNDQREGYTLANVVFGGYIIILSGMVFGLLIRDRVSRKVDMFYSLVGMALFVAAGSAIISYFTHLKYVYHNTKQIGLAGGSLAIVNAFVLLIDAVLTYKDVHEYTPH